MSGGSTTTAYRVTVSHSVDDIGEATWTALADACAAPVFSRYAFVRSVELAPLTFPSRAHYVQGWRPDGELAAVLPVYLQHSRDPFATGPGPHPELTMLVGHVWHCYDTVLLHREPLTAELVAPMWQAVGELAARLGARLWGLANIAVDGPLAAVLAEAGVDVQPTVPRYQLTLEHGPASLDEHLAGVGRSSRRTLRRYVRRAREAGAVTTLRQGSEVTDDEVLALCLATADKHAPGYYPPDRLAALIDALGPDCGVLRIELGGRLLAVSICLYDQQRMHAWAGGCVYPDELNWSPQYVLFAAELEAGMASGRRTLECGRRNDEFKSRYGLRAQPLAKAVVRR